MSEMDEELLEDLYSWVDQIPLTRPKKDIRRDFSDGVLVAEMVHSFVPGLVELHNYPSAAGTTQKVNNWTTMNRKVFRKLGFEITDDVMKKIANSEPWAIEQFLMMLRRKIDRFIYEQNRSKERQVMATEYDHSPEADRPYHRGTNYGVTGSKQHGHVTPGRVSQRNSVRKAESLQDVHRPPASQAYRDTMHMAEAQKYKSGSELVPKLVVEEKEQEVLAKEETIQILQAKVRRLEHLLHLKDVRIDDLQTRLDKLESQIRPIARR